MYITTQFSIFMVNKPGALAKMLGQFAHEKINIIAMTMMDSAEQGVMRVVFDSPKTAQGLLTDLNMPFNATDVLCINLDNQSGALASVAEKLAKNHINISYAYCTAGGKGGKTTGVVKVADVKKAMRILEKDRGIKVGKSQPQLRRAKSASF